MLLDTFHTITLDNVSLLLGIGITATLAQLALTRAIALAKLWRWVLWPTAL